MYKCLLIRLFIRISTEMKFKKSETLSDSNVGGPSNANVSAIVLISKFCLFLYLYYTIITYRLSV